MDTIIAIIGIGYVGLQNAMAFSNTDLKIIAFDTNQDRINNLRKGIDKNHNCTGFIQPNLIFTSDPERLKEANFFIVSIPTPINEHKVPDIFPLKQVSKDLAKVIKKDDVIVLESTVFPGATRDLVIPLLEKKSGLTSGIDFYVGYSSERIVPGDAEHNISNTVKVISAQHNKALNKILKIYQKIPNIVLHIAPSIEVGEASKLLENIQRDVNIALMNEYSQIMEKMNISMHDVLEASKTKWNFLPFRPGLVGGHCIPEDPYYLIYQANKLEVFTNLISCARQINEQFVYFIQEVLIKLLTKQDIPLRHAKIIILGLSYKSNVNDTRHSLSLALNNHLKELGMSVKVCDPIADDIHENVDWIDFTKIHDCHALVLTQPHDVFTEIAVNEFNNKMVNHGVFMDLSGIFFAKKKDLRSDILFWSL